MTHTDLLQRLAHAFRQPLPGLPAQVMMAPRPPRRWPAGFTPDRIRHAAGLLLVFPIDGAPHVILTVRSEQVRHRGQVSLPGGVIEPGETIEQTALREAHEEVGLVPDGVRVLGALTPLDIPVTGFRLHPVVATLDRSPVLRAAHDEVARIMQVSIATLLDPSTVSRQAMDRDGYQLDVPVFIVGDTVIWGATAMVLAEFLALLGWTVGLIERS